MKIAVDVRPLSHTITGIGRYTLNVLTHLMQDSRHEWFLYSDAPLATGISLPTPHVFRVPIIKPRFSSSLIAQAVFPYWATKDKIDLFWSPRHHLPLIMPRAIKRVVTIHDIVWFRHPETMTRGGRLLERLLMMPSIKAADRVISVSEFTRSELTSALAVADSKIHVTPLAATPAKDTALAALPAQLQAGRYILFVGTLEPRKNLPGLIKAFAGLPTHYRDYKLVIAGQDGWLQQALSNMLEESGISCRSMPMGYVNEALLHCLYQNAAVVAMPSIYEGYGLSALEAMQYGTPVVVGKATEIARIASPLVYVCENIGEDAILHALKLALAADYRQPHLTQTWQDTAKQTLTALESI
jgi:glycosyltransferase involved in cell wall biosynthesis